MLRKTTYLLSALAIIFTFSAVPLYGSHDVIAKDKGVLKEVVLIHHKLPKDFDFGKPDNQPGKPVAPCTETQNDSVNDWGATGWHMPTNGLTYKINFNSIPDNVLDTDFQNAIAASTSTWEQVDNGLNWYYGGSTNKKNSKYDGVNLVAFGSAMGGIAVTRTWYWTGTGEVAESDMIFAKNLKWSVTNPNAGDCAGVEGTYDVQNIATHEFGHQVGLEDLYSKTDKDLTMYGYGTMTELKKDSLGTGDVNGAKAVTP